MGLDMYLEGHKFLMTDWDNPQNNVMEDGVRLRSKILELGYWRKHPDLHGFIVREFADGRDECQEIELCEEDILNIITVVQDKQLPHTEGFFFGTSSEEDDIPTIEILTKALEWLRDKSEADRRVIRSVIYRASW